MWNLSQNLVRASYMSELYGVPAYKLNTYKFNAIPYSVTERVTFGTLKTAFFHLVVQTCWQKLLTNYRRFALDIDSDFTNSSQANSDVINWTKNDLCLSPQGEGPLTDLFVKKLVMNYLWDFFQFSQNFLTKAWPKNIRIDKNETIYRLVISEYSFCRVFLNVPCGSATVYFVTTLRDTATRYNTRPSMATVHLALENIKPN